MAVTGRRVSVGTGSKAGCEAPVAQLEIVCAGLGFSWTPRSVVRSRFGICFDGDVNIWTWGVGNPGDIACVV